MGIEEFAECYATRTNQNLESIVEYCRTMGAEDIHYIVRWYHMLPAEVVTVMMFLYSDPLKKFLRAALAAVITDTALTALILMLGAVAWTDLIEAMVHCEDRLSA
jgi:hypothetical protein